jgi:predicted phage terminase large subunit-like protein
MPTLKLPPLSAIRIEAARRSLETLCRLDQPDWDWSQPFHAACFAAAKALEPGKCLAVELPIRHGKTELFTIRGAAKAMLRKGARVLLVGNTQTLAESFSRSVKERLRLFGIEAGMKDGAQEWSTPWGSTLYAVGVGGAIEGRGFTDIFIDDPVKSREEAESARQRDTLWQWFTDSMWGRREPGCRLILVMSRWHQDDIIGRIKAGAHHAALWTFLTITALAVEGDPLGRQPGEALWPARWTREHLEQERDANPRNFEARYQANPTSPEGDFFKPGNITIVQTSQALGIEQAETVVKLDLGYTTSGDYSALCQMWKLPDGRYLCDIRRARESIDERNKWIERECRARNAKVLIPQDGGAGKDTVAVIGRLLAGLSIEAHPERGSKMQRAEGFAAQVNLGNVIFLESPDARAAIEEMRVFPNGANDDTIDALSGAFNDLAQDSGWSLWESWNV